MLWKKILFYGQAKDYNYGNYGCDDSKSQKNLEK